MDTSDIRKGLKFMMDGNPYVVVDFQFVKPGKGQAFTRTKMRNLLNGSTINDKLAAPNGRVHQAVDAKKPPKEIVQEFYLATLSRRPAEKEEAAALKLLSAAPNPYEGAEDLMWGLLNMKEFVFNH